MCEFKGIINGRIECECEIKSIFNSFLLNYTDKYNLIYRFNVKPKIISLNLWVTKCFLSLLTKNNFYSNKFGLIVLGVLLINIIGAFIFRLNEYNSFIYKLSKIIQFTQMLSDKTKNKK